MLKAVLTGGIATGKSYVRARFERLGAAVLDADRFAHGVMAAGTEAAAAIAARFGAGVLAPDGSVNRPALAPLVFGDAEARRALESIVHPAVYRAIQAAIRALEISEHPQVTIVEIPLVYETGHAGDFDRVIAAVCREATQMARLVSRGLSEQEARQRLAAQMPAAEKAARADYVIETDGTFEQTDRRVDSVWQALCQASASAPS